MTRCANSTSCKKVHISPGLDALASSPKLTATEVVSKSSLVEVSVRAFRSLFESSPVGVTMPRSSVVQKLRSSFTKQP